MKGFLYLVAVAIYISPVTGGSDIQSQQKDVALPGIELISEVHRNQITNRLARN